LKEITEKKKEVEKKIEEKSEKEKEELKVKRRELLDEQKMKKLDIRCVLCGFADPRRFNADPDPVFNLSAAPGGLFTFNAVRHRALI
jgi:hypothetical protein